MEISNVSEISDDIPFSQDGNLQLFEIFRLYSLFIGWISNISKFSDYIPLQRMEIHEVYSRKITSDKVLIQFTYLHILEIFNLEKY